jgi:predicted transcriptional regulator
MVAVMAERKEAAGAKVNLGVRVTPAVKTRLEEIAEEISRERYPATVTAGELAAVAVQDYIDRYERAKAKGK